MEIGRYAFNRLSVAYSGCNFLWKRAGNSMSTGTYAFKNLMFYILWFYGWYFDNLSLFNQFSGKLAYIKPTVFAKQRIVYNYFIREFHHFKGLAFVPGLSAWLFARNLAKALCL